MFVRYEASRPLSSGWFGPSEESKEQIYSGAAQFSLYAAGPVVFFLPIVVFSLSSYCLLYPSEVHPYLLHTNNQCISLRVGDGLCESSTPTIPGGVLLSEASSCNEDALVFWDGR